MRLNKNGAASTGKLRASEEALSTKQAEHAQLEGEYRDLSEKRFHAHPLLLFLRLHNRMMEVRKEKLAMMKKVFLDVSMEHTSKDVRAAGDAARPVAGTAKKRRCLGSADVLDEVVERQIANLSTEAARRFQIRFAQQVEKVEKCG